MDSYDFTDKLISTGKAASMLGVSRQHVVDLCERGLLAYTTVGTHRRVRRSEVIAMSSPEPRREDERLLWLHGVVAGRLLADPVRVLGKARANLTRLHGSHERGVAGQMLDEWRRITDQGVDPTFETLTSHSPQATDLRQNSPFAGVLSEAERQQVLTSFREHWQTEHRR